MSRRSYAADERMNSRSLCLKAAVRKGLVKAMSDSGSF